MSGSDKAKGARIMVQLKIDEVGKDRTNRVAA